LPLFDKDDFLEGLLDLYPKVDAHLRFRLSRQADDDMQFVVAQQTGAVVVSFWRREEVSTSAGTPTGWLRWVPNIVEVYCECSPVIAAKRFLERERHPGHGDANRSPDEITSQFEALAALGPLGIGELVRVNTEHPVDVEAVIFELSTRIRAAP